MVSGMTRGTGQSTDDNGNSFDSATTRAPVARGTGRGTARRTAGMVSGTAEVRLKVRPEAGLLAWSVVRSVVDFIFLC